MDIIFVRKWRVFAEPVTYENDGYSHCQHHCMHVYICMTYLEHQATFCYGKIDYDN